MLISAIQKFTMLDYPEKIACIIFTAGCNFRCGYCHNPEFVLPELLRKIKDQFIPEEAVFNFLKQRQGLVEGVVITGGEPTIHPDLLDFIRRVKSLEFLVKLDTNGTRPDIIKAVLSDQLVDYIAMDVKTSLTNYADVVAAKGYEAKLAKSIALLKDGSIDYEFRATILKEAHTPEILQNMKELVRGAKKFYLQPFRPAHTLDPTFANYTTFTREEFADIKKLFSEVVEMVEVR